jgi:chemotaxis methyl-accepting protein methylase
LPDKEGLIKIIEKKLKNKGVLALTTQENVKKIVKEVESMESQKKDVKIYRHKLITIFTKHYPYSFVIFEK